MTRDDIISMEAGRGLDILVAEKVMELEVCTNPEHDEADWCRKCQLHTPAFYSTVISAAWEVWEWLRRRFFSVKLMVWDHVTNAHVEIHHRQGHGEHIPDVKAYASSVELAICQAALLAVIEV